MLNALGFGFGPLFVGMLSDILTPSMGEAVALQWGITAVLPVYIIASAIMWFGRKEVAKDLDGQSVKEDVQTA